MTQHELVKCPHCESTSIFIHQEDDLCLCGECGEAWEQATKAHAVPEGYKLVPVKPNHSMRRVMVQVINISMPVMEMVEAIYSAGVAAAPETPK